MRAADHSWPTGRTPIPSPRRGRILAEMHRYSPARSSSNASERRRRSRRILTAWTGHGKMCCEAPRQE